MKQVDRPGPSRHASASSSRHQSKSGNGSQKSRSRRGSSSSDEDHKRKVFEACIEIILTVIEPFLPKKVYRYSARHFHRKFRQCLDCKNLTDDKGQNLLAMIILEGRVDLLEPLFFCGALADMAVLKICNPGSGHHGLMAKDIINKYRLKKIEVLFDNFTKLEGSMTELHKLARSGNVEAVRAHLLSMEPEMMQNDGSSSLMWAVTSGNLEVVEMIVKAGLQREYQDQEYSGETPLGRATYLGYANIIKYLIEKLHFDPNEKCKGDLKPVAIAMDNEDLDVLRMLVEWNAIITNNILPRAAQIGNIEIWQFVYRCIKDVDIDWKDENGRTPLCIAVQHGCVDIAKDIILNNGSLIHKDLKRRNILFAAIDCGNTDMFKVLIEKLKSKALLKGLLKEHDQYCGKERSFTITGRDNGVLGYHILEAHRVYLDILATRLHEGGQLDVLDYGKIVRSGLSKPSSETIQDINRRYDVTTMESSKAADMTPLHYAILHKQTDMALTLIKEGADVDARDSFGNQPVHLAAMRNDVEVIRALEDHKINFETPGELNMTPQEIAEANRHYDLGKHFESKTTMTMETLERFGNFRH